MPELDIYLLCHNRPELAKKAIDSILQQKYQNFNLTISDNSTNDEMQTMVSSEYPNIRYIRRKPSVPAIDHFNQCLQDISLEYFCLFHDDDIMLPEYTESIHLFTQTYPETIAFGPNALIELNGKIEEKTSFSANTSSKSISTPQDLLKVYFGRYQSGIAPFPGYVYKTKKIGSLKFTTLGGKYSDVIWLLQIIAKSPITWITKPLLMYNIHGDNDGLKESLNDRLKFLGFLKQNPSFSNKRLTADYRFFIYKKVLGSKTAITHPRRIKRIRAFMRNYRLCRFFRFEEYLDMFKKHNLQKL